MDFKGFPVKIDQLFLHRSDEAQENIRATAGDVLFAEEYVREIARNVARENFQYAKESSNKNALMIIIIQYCIEKFNKTKLGSDSISKNLESFFKIYDRKE